MLIPETEIKQSIIKNVIKESMKKRLVVRKQNVWCYQNRRFFVFFFKVWSTYWGYQNKVRVYIYLGCCYRRRKRWRISPRTYANSEKSLSKSKQIIEKHENLFRRKKSFQLLYAGECREEQMILKDTEIWTDRPMLRII